MPTTTKTPEEMPTHGLETTQNYDLVTKWLAETFQGQTLDVLGVKSGRIIEAFGFEPIDIKVSVERVDLMLRDEAGKLFHLEEQRNLRSADLYRFASYHFRAAKQWGAEVRDIILASGDVMAGTKAITTHSGTYTPEVIDFTQRNGEQRLREIRESVEAGTFDQWLELVFLPLYGTATGLARARLAEEVIHFEKALYQADIIPDRLLAATLIMSNKLIDKARLYKLWEDIKMLDILEIAEEKGIEKGKTLGMLEAMQEVVIETLLETCGLQAASLSTQIRRLTDIEVLKGLHRYAIKCRDPHEFAILLQQIG